MSEHTCLSVRGYSYAPTSATVRTHTRTVIMRWSCQMGGLGAVARPPPHTRTVGCTQGEDLPHER